MNRSASRIQLPDDRRGRDDEGRAVVVVGGEREEHRGLPEPHVVGEDPAELVALEPDEPVEAVALVVAQGDLDRCPARRCRSAGSGRQRPGERAGEPAVGIEVDLELGVVVLVGVRRGLEHRRRIGGAEPADELGDARALAVGEEREPAAERDEVVVRADERVDLGRVSVSSPTRTSPVRMRLATSKPVALPRHAGSCGSRCGADRGAPGAPPTMPALMSFGAAVSTSRTTSSSATGATHRFVVFQRGPGALRGRPLGLDQMRRPR